MNRILLSLIIVFAGYLRCAYKATDHRRMLNSVNHQREQGKLAKDQLRAFAENHNLLKKKTVERLLAEAKNVRQFQIKNLRKRGYIFKEKDIPLPNAIWLGLGMALLVDYETPLSKQCELLGIWNSLDFNYQMDLFSSSEDYPNPPGVRRWGWIYGVEDGEKMLGKSPNQAVKEFQSDNPMRRGLMTAEGLALYRENPDILKNHFIDFPGSIFNLGTEHYALNLHLYKNHVRIGYGFRVDSYPEQGSASAVFIW